MADANTSLPVRTQNNGDVVTFVADGTVSTQLLKVNADGSINVDQNSTPWNTKDAADGPVTPGTVAANSTLIGGQYNTSLPTLTNGQQAAVQVNSSGILFAQATNFPVTVDTNYGTVGASTLRSAAQIGNATGAADFNYGTVGAQTLRSAAQVGNATGAADFNNGVTGAQTLRVAANLAVGGANVTTSNPVPVTVTSAQPGTPVQDYHTQASLAAGASTTFTYTVAVAHTFSLMRVWCTASGKLKAIIQNNGSTIFAGFNSTANPNIDITVVAPPTVAAGNTVTVTLTNDDNQAMDVYATIEGNQN